MPSSRQRWKRRLIQKSLEHVDLSQYFPPTTIDQLIAYEENFHSGALLTLSRQAYRLEMPAMAAAYGFAPETWRRWETRREFLDPDFVDRLLNTHPIPWVPAAVRTQWNAEILALVGSFQPESHIIDMTKFMPRDPAPVDSHNPYQRFALIKTFLYDFWDDHNPLETYDASVSDAFYRITRTALGMPALLCPTPNVWIWLIWMVTTLGRFLNVSTPHLDAAGALLEDLEQLEHPRNKAPGPFAEWRAVLEQCVSR